MVNSKRDSSPLQPAPKTGPRANHVMILGCGYTGRFLAQRLAFKGTPVVATSRTEQGANIIRTRGAHPLIFDGKDLEVLRRWRGRVQAIVYSIPPSFGPAGEVEEGTAAVLELVRDWGLKAFIYLSSTSVYGDKAGAICDESSVCSPDSPRGVARLAIEAAVLAETKVNPMVIRPAGIYGQHRSQLHRLASGRYRLVADGAAFTNRIHVVDLAAMIERALKRGTPGAIYLGSDEAPSTQAQVAEHIVATYGLGEPSRMPLKEAKIRLSKDVLAMILGSKRLDSSQTRKALKLRLKFPSYVEGLADVWRAQRAELEALAAAGRNAPVVFTPDAAHSRSTVTS